MSIDSDWDDGDYDRPAKAPEGYVVNVLKPELCTDGETSLCRSYRYYPEFMAKAAYRMLDYLARRHGAGNAWIEEC